MWITKGINLKSKDQKSRSLGIKTWKIVFRAHIRQNGLIFFEPRQKMISDPFYACLRIHITRKCLVFVIICNLKLCWRAECRSSHMAVYVLVLTVLLSINRLVEKAGLFQISQRPILCIELSWRWCCRSGNNSRITSVWRYTDDCRIVMVHRQDATHRQNPGDEETGATANISSPRMAQCFK